MVVESARIRNKAVRNKLRAEEAALKRLCIGSGSNMTQDKMAWIQDIEHDRQALGYDAWQILCNGNFMLIPRHQKWTRFGAKALIGSSTQPSVNLWPRDLRH